MAGLFENSTDEKRRNQMVVITVALAVFRTCRECRVSYMAVCRRLPTAWTVSRQKKQSLIAQMQAMK